MACEKKIKWLASYISENNCRRFVECSHQMVYFNRVYERYGSQLDKEREDLHTLIALFLFVDENSENRSNRFMI